MNPAAVAIKAARAAPVWGLYAAMRYALKRGASFAQFNVALQFEERRAMRRRLSSDFGGYLA